MRREGLFIASIAAAVSLAGCKGCKKDESSSGYVFPTATPPETNAETPHVEKKTKEDPVHGLWSQRPFLARAALVHLHPTWLTLTLLDREAKCDSARLSDNDMGIQLSVPSGPDNDFFAGRDVPVELRLHGATGVSRIPAGHVIARIEPFDPKTAETVGGALRFRFRTAADDDAPAYESAGPFEATLCNNLDTKPSIGALPTTDTPVHGKVGKREVKMRTFLAYTREDGSGGKIVMLKGYERDVPCHTTRSATPYLFGAEVGPGADGKHFVGSKLPVEWMVQMRTDAYSERTVHAAQGSSWLRLESVSMDQGGTVRGELAATNPDDDPAYRFTLSGRFEAKFCGHERRAW